MSTRPRSFILNLHVYLYIFRIRLILCHILLKQAKFTHLFQANRFLYWKYRFKLLVQNIDFIRWILYEFCPRVLVEAFLGCLFYCAWHNNRIELLLPPWESLEIITSSKYDEYDCLISFYILDFSELKKLAEIRWTFGEFTLMIKFVPFMNIFDNFLI